MDMEKKKKSSQLNMPYGVFSLHMVKQIYPVSALGGTRYISAIMKPFHDIPMVASQGITIG